MEIHKGEAAYISRKRMEFQAEVQIILHITPDLVSLALTEALRILMMTCSKYSLP